MRQRHYSKRCNRSENRPLILSQQVTLAAGSNTYDIGTVHNIENYYMGNPTSYDVTIYEIE